jgi:S-DNA-T family DNA segregation ATPase FtsK/SpoIIIE
MAGPGEGADRSAVIGLTVRHAQHTRDLIADLPYGATAGSLALALGGEFPSAHPFAAIHVERTGETLPNGAMLAACDIRSGDIIQLRYASSTEDPIDVSLRRTRPAEEELVTLRPGPQTERSEPPPEPRDAPDEDGAPTVEVAWPDGAVRIGPGEHVLGSGSARGIRIDAPGMPRLAFEIEVGEATRVRALIGGPSLSLDGVVIGSDWQVVPDGARVRVGAAELVVRKVHDQILSRSDKRLIVSDAHGGRTQIEVSPGGEIPFNRPPRRGARWHPGRVELPDAPRPPGGVRLPLVAALVPLVAGLLMFVILQSAVLIAFMALSPIMALGTYLGDRHSGRSTYNRDLARYEARLTEASASLARALTQEQRERGEQAPPLAAIARWASELDDRLWERRPWDPDFLCLSPGRGRLASQTEAVLPRSPGDDGPDARATYIANAYRELDAVPYVLPLEQAAAVGFVGDRPTSVAAVRALVLQAALLHSPAELGIAAALPLGAESGWEWLKWLPHAKTAASMLSGPALGTGRRGPDVLGRLRTWQRRRLDEREAHFGRSPETSSPALLVIVDEELQLDRSLVSEILANARELRTPVIWIGRDARGLPGQCQVMVDAAPNRSARVVQIDTGEEHAGVVLEGADAAMATWVARALAPIRDVTTASAAASLPTRVRLLDQLGLMTPSAQELATRWQKTPRGIGAVIGSGAGEPMEVDLRADGPHALIAGTTGAGKSELLRTLVASLAASHPPSRLTFLLVDYKGGAAFEPCRPFPHVLDVVSDLDAELGERALVSLDAEMKRRERLLAETRSDNLIDLERRSPHLAAPNLVIMVDEFAKLRDEIPDFIDGVVDVAQRGRSLGIHMVLAAQSLRTAFTPAVRANTNLRIALRVTSDTESEDVVDAPDAARIPSGDAARGRAFARIGHDRLLEFQTAHVSGRHVRPSDAEVLVRPFPFDTPLAASARRRDGDEPPPGSEETDIAALARAAQGASELLGLPSPRPAWTPPLPERLLRSVVQQHTRAAAGECAIGLVDKPAEQRRTPLLIELDRGHLGIFGISGSGKTTALHTIAATLAWDASPDEVEIYAIDAASGTLGVIEPLPHVGGVVPITDGERIERLLGRLEREVATRSARFVAVGAATLAEYRAAASSSDVPPRIVLLLDGFGEFAATLDEARADSPFERIVALLASGRSVGIHVVVTADRRGAVRSNVTAHLAHRIVLRLASPDDLVAFGIPTKLADTVELGPGRGFTADAALAQIALPQPSSEGDLAAGFRALGEHLSAAWPGRRAPAVDSLPATVTLAQLSDRAPANGRLPVGIGGPTLEAVGIDIADRHFIVSGPYRSGRSNALSVIASQARRTSDVAMHLLAPRRSPLLDRGPWTSVARGPIECAESAKALASQLAETGETSEPRVLVIVDDAGELQDAHSAAALESLVRLGRDRGVRVAAAAETSAARMMTNMWLRDIRRDGQGVLLTPEGQTDGDILGVALPRRQRVPMVPGRGYLVIDGAAVLIQLALAG